MRTATIAFVMSLAAAVALAEEPATDAAAAEETLDQPEAESATPAKEEKLEHSKALRLPPGFFVKKHGKHELYCKRDSAVGTRFKTEKCFDEARMRDYLLSQEQNNRDFDRARSTCSSIGHCGGG